MPPTAEKVDSGFADDSSRFCSSRFFKQAVLGFMFRSLTWCSRLLMTSTAWWRMFNFVCAFSAFKWSIHILPSSLKASFMSRTRTLRFKVNSEEEIACQYHHILETNKEDDMHRWGQRTRSPFFYGLTERVEGVWETAWSPNCPADSTYLSLALFACRLSFSFSILTSGGSSSFPEELWELNSSSSSNSLRVLTGRTLVRKLSCLTQSFCTYGSNRGTFFLETVALGVGFAVAFSAFLALPFFTPASFMAEDPPALDSDVDGLGCHDPKTQLVNSSDIDSMKKTYHMSKRMSWIKRSFSMIFEYVDGIV